MRNLVQFIKESYGTSTPISSGDGMGAVEFPADPSGDVAQTLDPDYKTGSDFVGGVTRKKKKNN